MGVDYLGLTNRFSSLSIHTWSSGSYRKSQLCNLAQEDLLCPIAAPSSLKMVLGVVSVETFVRVEGEAEARACGISDL